MNTTNTGFVTVNGAQVYYETAGTGEVVILGHAGFVDSGMWDAQWSALAQQFKVVRYDMLGFGKSDAAAGPVSRRAELESVLQQLDIHTAHLIGCSMSGATMLDFTLEHPERVQSLTIVSAVPGGFEMQGPPPPHIFEMFGALQQGDEVLASELQMRIWIDGGQRQPEQVDPQVRQRAAIMTRIPIARRTTLIVDSQQVNPLTPPAVNRLDEINCPTLIVAGALDHPEVLRAAEVMTAEIKSAKKIIVPNAAHIPNMEQPTIFNESVFGFLQKQKN
ncbi:MAG: alpha/beta hydrolase [Anaerolineae bacterium]